MTQDPEQDEEVEQLPGRVVEEQASRAKERLRVIDEEREIARMVFVEERVGRQAAKPDVIEVVPLDVVHELEHPSHDAVRPVGRARGSRVQRFVHLLHRLRRCCGTARHRDFPGSAQTVERGMGAARLEAHHDCHMCR